MRQFSYFLVLGCYFAFASILAACDIPVFRYALENWQADCFRLTVVYEDKLLDSEQQCLQKLQKIILNGEVNLQVRVCKFADIKNRDLALLKDKIKGRVAVMVLQYPQIFLNDKPIWSVLCTKNNMEQLLNSSLREKLITDLVGDSSAVWIFLQSGDEKKDAKLLQNIKKTLKQLEHSIKLAKVQEHIKIKFSLLKLSINDCSESVMLKILLNSEGDLQQLVNEKEPMLFPVFGRGRLLYALIGRGINEDTITTTAKFIAGRCSCEIKSENPGCDLLLQANWGKLVTITQNTTTTQQLPLLTGVMPNTPETNTGAKINLKQLDNKTAPPKKHNYLLIVSSVIVLLSLFMIICSVWLIKNISKR